MLLDPEYFKNNKKFLVTNVVVELGKVESSEMKGYWINFIIWDYNRQDNSESIIGYICFYDELSIGDLMCKD